MKKVLLVFAVMTGFLMNAQEAVPGITVSGEGTVYVKPDQVIVNIGVEHTGDYVKEVKEQTEEAIDNVIDFLRKAGVDEKNIQTQYIRLDKQYEYQTKTYHFSSSQSISIKIENIENYEKILTGLMDAGVNRINGVEFKSSEADKYIAEARVKAIKNAKEKAQDYAGALGQKVGKAIMISDGSAPIQRVNRLMAFKAMDIVGAESKDSIAPGQLAISANVTVTFNLN